MRMFVLFAALLTTSAVVAADKSSLGRKVDNFAPPEMS